MKTELLFVEKYISHIYSEIRIMLLIYHPFVLSTLLSSSYNTHGIAMEYTSFMCPPETTI